LDKYGYDAEDIKATAAQAVKDADEAAGDQDTNLIDVKTD
jgi:hypothetical protein